jgi:hypothetical protein
LEEDADKAQSKSHQRKGRPPSDFVVEEEMLESEEADGQGQQKVPKKGKTPTPTAGRKAAAGAGSSGGLFGIKFCQKRQ